MKKSNIFVHIELSKLTQKLHTDAAAYKDVLRAQAGYFNIIPSKYFSDALSNEWDEIAKEVKTKGPKVDDQGRVIANAVVNTIDQMSLQQCDRLVNRIRALQKEVKKEFE